MLWTRQNKTAAGKRGKLLFKIHSAPAVQKERGFVGAFEVSGSTYNLTYTPARAEIVNRKLNLLGNLVITDPRKRKRTRQNVRAVLASMQGGIGTAPQPASARAASSTGTNGSRDEESSLPVTESAGDLSFCGVIYLRLEAIDGLRLGVRADLSRTQLNARLAPNDELEVTLQYLYSRIVDALYVESPDLAAAEQLVKELNAHLAGP